MMWYHGVIGGMLHGSLRAVFLFGRDCQAFVIYVLVSLVLQPTDGAWSHAHFGITYASSVLTHIAAMISALGGGGEALDTMSTAVPTMIAASKVDGYRF